MSGGVGTGNNTKSNNSTPNTTSSTSDSNTNNSSNNTTKVMSGSSNASSTSADPTNPNSTVYQHSTKTPFQQQHGVSRNMLRLNFGPLSFGDDPSMSASGQQPAGAAASVPSSLQHSNTLPISQHQPQHQQFPLNPNKPNSNQIRPIPLPTAGSGSGTSSSGGRSGIPPIPTNTMIQPQPALPLPQPHLGRFGTGVGGGASGAAGGLWNSGTLSISPELTFDFTAEDLEDLGEIGRGAYGTVNKMLHKHSSTTIAVKRIRCTVDEREQKKLMMDLEVVMRSNACPFIVKFFGAVFKEGDCWICMELMDSSLEQFYKYVYRKMEERIQEPIIGQIALATVRALSYLKEELKIIHRDVKPSNILLDKQGNIKLCDFGISGQLVDSIAQSRDAGCRPYMAPERIDPSSAKGYDIRSDVWSLGITLIEISTGKFPYPKWNSIFEQLSQVVQGEPPRLSTNSNGYSFTPQFVDFVNTCLIKNELQRPKYARLLKHPFILRSASERVDVKSYFSDVFDAMGPSLQQRLEDLLLYDDY